MTRQQRRQQERQRQKDLHRMEVLGAELRVLLRRLNPPQEPPTLEAPPLSTPWKLAGSNTSPSQP